MFTGLVVEMGEVISVERKGKTARLIVDAKALGPEAKLGDSIAINGTCLTVVDIKGSRLSFDVSDETLKATNLGKLNPKDRVNLEPALRMSDRLGGHIVTGHIDCVGRIRSKNRDGEVWKIFIEAGPEITGYIVEKGSIAVDGISLTVVEVLKDGFSLVIIPHTAKLTTIGLKGPGDSVNLEADILGKYVARFLNKGKDARLMQALISNDFV